MNKDDLINIPAQKCTKCEEYQVEIDAYGAILLVIALAAPIIGILIGLFVGKKLLSK